MGGGIKEINFKEDKMLKADIEKHEVFAKLWRKIRTTGEDINFPTQQEIDDVEHIVMNIGGNLSEDYIAKIIMAYNYAKNHHHKRDKTLLLYDNLIARKRIFLSSYTKTEE